MEWLKNLFYKPTIKDFIKRRCSLMDYYLKNNALPKYLYINKELHRFVKREKEICKVLNRSEEYRTYKNIKTGKLFRWIWKSQDLLMDHIFVVEKNKDKFDVIPITFFDYAMKNEKLPAYIKNNEDAQIYKFNTNGGGGFDHWANRAGYKGITTGHELSLMWYGEDRLMNDEIIVLEER